MKYVLCKPRGGLNDTLCEIEKCWRYAEKHHRYLLIDSTESGLHDDFWNYFSTSFMHRSSVIRKNNYTELNKLTAKPSVTEGKLDSYISKYSPVVNNFIEIESKQKLTFNMDLGHKEDVLVHEQCWEGEFLSIYCLDGLVFKPHIQEYIKAKIAKLGEYVSVHVRNTDYKMDYKYQFMKMKEDVAGKTLLVCSDDYQVFKYAREFFDKTKVVRLSTFKDNGGEPLHHKHHSNQEQVNLEMFTDLLAMAQSQKLYISNVNNIQKYSGFTLLAYTLQQNPEIVHKLLNGSAG